MNYIPNELIHTDVYFHNEEQNNLLSKDKYGLRWIYGDCEEVFSTLTRLERMILSYHLKGLSDPKIASLLGYHVNTVYRKRKSIIKKVRSNL